MTPRRTSASPLPASWKRLTHRQRHHPLTRSDPSGPAAQTMKGTAPRMKNLGYDLVTLAAGPSDLEAVATPMFWLMFRNVASDGFVFQDPIRPGVLSEPGCILASPSWE